MTDPNAQTPAPAGCLVIDKQPGFTSMDVCAILRTRLRRAGAPKRIKVGHAGTLDPLATGVLVVLIGKATSLVSEVMAQDKEYETTVDLSRRSTSDDRGGEVTPVEVREPPTGERLQSALTRFTGEIEQVPPQFSAMRVGGRRAYDLAREGEVAPLKARRVTVHSIELVRYEWPLVGLKVRCGKGVYIRSIARDLGAALGTGGMLTDLRRTRVGRFDLAMSKTLDDLPQRLTQADLLPPPRV